MEPEYRLMQFSPTNDRWTHLKTAGKTLESTRAARDDLIGFWSNLMGEGAVKFQILKVEVVE